MTPPKHPKTTNDCEECKIYEAKIILWNDEVGILGGIQHEILGLLPTSEEDVTLIQQINENCKQLSYWREQAVEQHTDHVVQWQSSHADGQPHFIDHLTEMEAE